MAFRNILISLVIVILLSLFFFIADYRDKISNAEITRQQLSLLEILDPVTDTDERLTQLLDNGNEQAWIHLAKHHANASASTAFELGEYYLKQMQVSAAQLWYEVAIRQQHVAARLALANIYFDQHQYADIKPLLLPIMGNESALALLYKLALQQGELSFIQTYKNKLSHGENAGFYNELEQFSVFSQHREETSDYNSTCSINVQLFATNLAGLRHGKALSSAFEQHKLAKYICVKTPKYIPAEVVNCQHLPTDKIRCDASQWLQRSDINSRYLGVIVEQGGANVDNGIMYIDQQDNLDVLVHELSHFIGFVDEYPLPRQHQKCHQLQQTPFAHNLVVLGKYYQGERGTLRENILLQLPWRSLIKDSTPILSRHPQGWKLGTPAEHNDEIGMFATNSCNSKRDTQAFKPLAQRTKLEYFELDFPAIYLNIFKLDPKRYLMPSYHFNISRDLVGQGEYIKASEVLQVTLFD